MEFKLTLQLVRDFVFFTVYLYIKFIGTLGFLFVCLVYLIILWQFWSWKIQLGWPNLFRPFCLLTEYEPHQTVTILQRIQFLGNKTTVSFNDSFTLGIKPDRWNFLWYIPWSLKSLHKVSFLLFIEFEILLSLIISNSVYIVIKWCWT